ncbi:hypothetical protein ACVW00_001788 [Marmoricola sp. URHA0025 HA25]
MLAPLAPRLSSCVLAAALLLAAGCTGSDDTPSRAESPDSPPGQSVTVDSSPTPEEPSPTTSPSATGDLPLLDRLLPTGQVPGLNAEWTWQDGDTGQPSTAPFGLCAKTAPGADLLSIGATDVVARTYFPPDDSDDNAAEQIAEFPDTATARRAWAVLASWHERCGKTLSADNSLKLGRFASVPVDEGTARWYLLSWAPAGEETGRFEALGMVLNGTRIAVLTMDHSGQDHDYPPGQDPMIGMVTAASGWLR